MNRIVLALLILLVASTLVLTGCNSEEPVAEKPETNVPKTSTAKQPQPVPKTNPEAEQAAVECALPWLALVDEGKYAESWDQSAELFRSAVPRPIWQDALEHTRKPLGKMLSRELLAKYYTTTLPKAPTGQYVIIQYKTSFENKESAIEKITPMLDKDGKWRISGYYVE